MTAQPEAVTIHSEWGGIVKAWLGAVAFVAVAVYANVANDSTTVGRVVLGIAAFLLGVVAFDYPSATTFTSDGLVRRCALRRHRIGWHKVRAITRHSPAVSARGLVGRAAIRDGGLVAVVGRRRYLLTNAVESTDEYEALVALAPTEPASRWWAGPSRVEVDPTWSSRRRKWWPPDALGDR